MITLSALLTHYFAYKQHREIVTNESSDKEDLFLLWSTRQVLISEKSSTSWETLLHWNWKGPISSCCPRNLLTNQKPAAAHLLKSWVRIPLGAWIFVCCECRVLSGRGLCDELITRPEESYRLCCVVVCDLETSRIGAPYIYNVRLLRVKDNTVRQSRL